LYRAVAGLILIFFCIFHRMRKSKSLRWGRMVAKYCASLTINEWNVKKSRVTNVIEKYDVISSMTTIFPTSIRDTHSITISACKSIQMKINDAVSTSCHYMNGELWHKKYVCVRRIFVRGCATCFIDWLEINNSSNCNLTTYCNYKFLLTKNITFFA
jgi:hypothetical protein